MKLAEWARGLLTNLRRNTAERDLREEMQLHRELRERELRDGGANPGEARTVASRRFGNPTVLSSRSRDAWGWRWLEELLNDLRIAARSLRKSPGFALIAAITLGIGIGANTALFSVIDAVLLDAAPFPNAARMISVHVSTALFPKFRLGLPWMAVEKIRTQADAIEHAAAYASSEKTMITNGEPSLLNVAGLSEAFFEQLGTRAQLGRLLVDSDHAPGRDHVAVISDALWRTRFGSSPRVIGQSLRLDDEAYTIVGVAPPRFSYPDETQAWMPLALSPAQRTQHTFFMLNVIGTLRQGTKLERAQQQLDAIASQIAKEAPDLGKGFALPATSLREEEMPYSRRGYFVLVGAALFVLLIACANLSSMLLARGLKRTREMALRAALGASRWRLIRHGLAESGLVALLGCAAGLCAAQGGIAVFRAIAPPDTPRLDQIALNPLALWFAVAISLIAGLALGLVPALRSAQDAPNDALKNTIAGAAAGRKPRLKFGGGLVVMEVGLAFVLLAGSALMTRTLANALRQSPGFRTDHLLTFDLPAPRQQFSRPGEAERQRNVQRAKAILQRVESVPGVEKAALTDYPLLAGMMSMSANLQVEGALPAKSSEERAAYSRAVSPGYFRMMQIPLVGGREFTEQDVAAQAPGILINETMARQYWNSLDVIGKRISTSVDEKKQPAWNEVIGVVKDTRDVLIIDRPSPEYFPLILRDTSGKYNLLVRTRLEPDALAKSISQAIWAEFPNQPVTRVMTLSQSIAQSLGDQRMNAVLLDAFAGIGLLLALVGVYGVISFAAGRRTQEVGIRMAIGAQPREILLMILRQGLLPVLIGTLLGAGGALGVGRLIASQLYGVKPQDPWTLILSTLLVLAIAGLACYVPARRATRVDPVVALRYD